MSEVRRIDVRSEENLRQRRESVGFSPDRGVRQKGRQLDNELRSEVRGNHIKSQKASGSLDRDVWATGQK